MGQIPRERYGKFVDPRLSKILFALAEAYETTRYRPRQYADYQHVLHVKDVDWGNRLLHLVEYLLGLKLRPPLAPFLRERVICAEENSCC